MYISGQGVCGVMAGQQSGIKNVTYSFGDAVALMPLSVGWKPTDGDYLDFFDHFIEYKSPRANLLTQSWTPYNSKVYDEVYAAMSLCRTGPLYALKSTLPLPPLKASEAASASIKNSLQQAFGKVQEIEDLINDCLSKAENETKITNNARDIRFDALSQLRVAAGDEAAKKIIVTNSHNTIRKMQTYFHGLNFWNRESWNGLELFDEFFAKLNSNDTDIAKRLGEQELNQYNLL